MKGENLRHSAAFILGGFVLFIFFWQAASMFLQLKALPPPLEVYAAWPRALEGGLPRHLAASLGRALAGLGLSLCLGLALGVPMGCCPKVDRLLGPLLYFSYPVPKLALLPVIMLLMGVGEGSKITVLALILSIRDAVHAVPEEDHALLTSLKANFMDKLIHIILPAVLPAVFSSLRVSIGIVFSALFFTETFGTDQGLGYYVTDSQMRLDYPLMYLGILALSLTAFILFLLVDAADRLLCRWR